VIYNTFAKVVLVLRFFDGAQRQSQLKIAAVFRWRRSDDAVKVLREMALTCEAAGKGNFRNRLAAILKKLPRFADASFDDIAMRRHTGRNFERVSEVMWILACHFRQFCKAQVISQMGIDKFDNPAQPTGRQTALGKPDRRRLASSTLH
jgi:hypothetical protein